MKLSEFDSVYLRLSKVYQEILFQLLIRLEKTVEANRRLYSSNNVKRNISKNIQMYRKEKKITLQKICNIVEEKGKGVLSLDTLNAIIKNNYQNSSWNEEIADALGITKRKLYYGEKPPKEIIENLQIMSANVCNIKWLFESLSERNQEAVLYLAKALLMSETSPEVFEDIGEYIE